MQRQIGRKACASAQINKLVFRVFFFGNSKRLVCKPAQLRRFDSVRRRRRRRRAKSLRANIQAMDRLFGWLARQLVGVDKTSNNKINLADKRRTPQLSFVCVRISRLRSTTSMSMI